MSEKLFKIVGNDISDGYHTFEELYAHRCLIFINLVLFSGWKAYWKPDFEHWFCLYLDTPQGQISYHVPDKYLPLVENRVPQVLAETWDGHKGDDVIQRLYKTASATYERQDG